MRESRWLPLFLGLLSFVPAKASALTLTADAAWPDREIPVCWEEPRPEHRQERQLIRKAVGASWERESALAFTGWRRCREEDRGVRIRLDQSYPRTLERGRKLDGVRDGIVLPVLWSFAALSVNLKAPVHEFGHVLGFGHEHARGDAPYPERCGLTGDDGTLYVEDDLPLTDFDTNSIMVACVTSATREFSSGVPQLSALDIFGLVQVYGSNRKNILDVDESGDRFGAALLLRDLDGNGTPDLAVGAPGEDEGEGAVYLYRGHPVSGFRPWARVSGADFGDARPAAARGFGSALSVIATGDGGHDLVIHDKGHRSNPPSAREGYRLKATFDRPPRPAGLVAVEPDAVPDDSAQLAPMPEGLERSRVFARIGTHGSRKRIISRADLNADGIEDWVIGLPTADGTAERSGIVLVYLAAQDGDRSVPAAYWFGQAY